MFVYFSRTVFLGFVVSSFFMMVMSTPVQSAGLVPCGRTIGTAEEQQPCTVCHIAVEGNRIVAYLLRIMTIVAITVIVAMAILYIVSTGDDGMMKTAKGGMKAALVGFAIMLGAWLIVNTTLRIMAIEETQETSPLYGLRQNGAFGFSCDTVSTTNR
ncbi:MAG: pilin [Minisyncoccota bacterium]